MPENSSIQRAWWTPWLLSMVVGSWIVIILGIFSLRIFGGIVKKSTVLLHSEFSAAAGRSAYSIAGELASGFFDQTQTEYRYLLLGTDEVEGSNRPTVLTDTIQIVSYRPSDRKVRFLSLPRDLYLPKYQTKINALYRQSMEQGFPPTQLPTEAVSDLLGVSLDGVIVVKMSDVANIIDIIDGIEVEVPVAFEDPLYPRDGVDVTVERNPAVLYETLRFEAGIQPMDGATAIKYARTRHSTDPAEGGDQARIRRQQQVLNAVVQKLFSETILANPTYLGNLYRWYSQRLASQVQLATLGNIAKAMQENGDFPEREVVGIIATDLPQPPTADTLLIHPPLEKYGGQWAYDLADPTGVQLREFIQNSGI